MLRTGCLSILMFSTAVKLPKCLDTHIYIHIQVYAYIQIYIYI